MANNSGKP